MAKNKKKLQTLIFNKNIYHTKRLIREWIKKHDYIIDKRLKYPIMKNGNNYRVRQRNPVNFKKSTFKTKNLEEGIKGVFGYLKNRK